MFAPETLTSYVLLYYESFQPHSHGSQSTSYKSRVRSKHFHTPLLESFCDLVYASRESERGEEPDASSAQSMMAANEPKDWPE
jgi:hypothetical protein